MCKNQFQKSILEVTNDAIQNLAATNGVFQFTDILTDTGCSIDFLSPSTVKLEKSGVYLVLFNTNLNTGTTAGVINTVMNINGQPVQTVSTIATATASNRTILLQKIVTVPKSCDCVNNTKRITFANTGIAASYNFTDLIIVKLA